MRQILLGTTLATSGTVASASAGALGFSYLNSGVPTFAISAATFKENFNAVLKRSASTNQGDVVLPISKNNFVWSKSKVVTGSAAAGNIDFDGITVTPGYDYTVIFVKKGIKFNERSKWTFTYRASANASLSTILTKLVAFVTANPALGLTAAIDTTTTTQVNFTAVNKGESFAIVCADEFISLGSTDIDFDTDASSALNVGDVAEYLRDLLSKAAADAGFRDTYREANVYPAYFGDGKADLSAYSSGAYVYTLRFAEKRVVRTVEDVVNQVVQLVLPASVTVTSLDSFLASLGNKID